MFEGSPFIKNVWTSTKNVIQIESLILLMKRLTIQLAGSVSSALMSHLNSASRNRICISSVVFLLLKSWSVAVLSKYDGLQTILFVVTSERVSTWTEWIYEIMSVYLKWGLKNENGSNRCSYDHHSRSKKNTAPVSQSSWVRPPRKPVFF